MALMVCLACSTMYAVGLARCPHCGSPDQVEQGSREHEMAKQSVHGGATHESDIRAAAPAPAAAVPAEDVTETVPDTPPDAAETAAERQSPRRRRGPGATGTGSQ